MPVLVALERLPLGCKAWLTVLRARIRTLLPSSRAVRALVINSLRASEKLARALEAGAFGALGVQRTYQSDLRFRSSDYIFVILVLFVTVGPPILNVGCGVGIQPIRLM
jgi:energy-coupling factor transporter transmembrane protein EcfT